MARVAVPVTAITKTGVAPAAEVNGDSTNNHTVSNNGQTWLEVRNADASNTHTVTVKFASTLDGQTVTSRTYTIGTSSSQKILLGSPQYYGDSTQVDVDSSQIKLTAYTLG